MPELPWNLRGRRLAEATAVALACVALANCTGAKTKLTSTVDPKYGVSASPRVIEPGQPVPKGGGTYRVGKPYVVAGRTYYPTENRRYRAEGIASWYGDDFHGRLTANGEIYDMEGISAAHPTMPMPSYARVTNQKNGRSIIVRVNDRGPYHADRVIDLSSKAAELLELRRAGTGKVRVEYVGPAALEGSDDRRLIATLREGAPAPAPSRVMVASARPFVPEVERIPAPPRRAALPAAAPAPEPSDDEEVAEAPPWSTDARAALRRHAPDPAIEPVRHDYARSESARSVVSQPLAPVGAVPRQGALQWQTGPQPVAVRGGARRDEDERVRYQHGAMPNGRGLY